MKFTNLKKCFLPFAVAGTILFSGCSVFGESDNKIVVVDSKTTFAKDALTPFIQSGEIPGFISVFCRGNVQEIACVGWANVEEKRPIAMDQIFMQCSQTKGFCGVTIAMLIEEGKISLDDPVSKYLPEFKEMKVLVVGSNKKTTLVPAKNVLTIRMVMNHTGGFTFEIPTKGKKGWPGLSLRDTAKEAASRPLRFEPGTNSRYSNTGIDIGAAIVEVVTGKKWEDFLKERIFDPLEMTSATFNPSDEQLKNSISLYQVKTGKKAEFVAATSQMPLPHNGPDIHPSAGAGLWINAADQLKFYRMLMNLGLGDNGVRILNEDTVKNLLATSTRPAALGNYSLGLRPDGKGNFGHGGAWRTQCTVNWKTKQLRMRVVQQLGSVPASDRAWGKAANQFFNMKINDSGTDSYTGRLK